MVCYLAVICFVCVCVEREGGGKTDLFIASKLWYVCVSMCMELWIERHTYTHIHHTDPRLTTRLAV